MLEANVNKFIITILAPMRLTTLLYICLHISLACSSVKIIPELREVTKNNVLKVYQDVKGNVHEVDKFEDIDAEALLKYGVVKVKSTESIISSERLANQAMSGSLMNQPISTLDEKITDEDDIFFEVSYKNIRVNKALSDWIPIGDCLKNEATTSATYTQGWTVTVGSGLNVNLQFAQIFSVQPSLGLDLTLSASVSGSIGCSLLPKKHLQFQAKVQTATISNVKTRKIVIKSGSRLGRKFTSLDIGDWQSVDPYTEVGKNVEVACVTDHRFQTCK